MGLTGVLAVNGEHSKTLIEKQPLSNKLSCDEPSICSQSFPNSTPSLKRLLLGEFSIKRIVYSVLFVYGFLFFYAWGMSDRLIFQPQSSSYKDTEEILKLTTSDGIQISAIHLQNPKAIYTLLYSHGNAEDLGDIRPVLNDLVTMGFSVFAYDYHGYGTSHGNPTEPNTYHDINAVYDHLTQKLKVLPDRIILYGRSVGTGPAVDLASRKPVAGLILESPFVSAFRVLTRIPILPFDKFQNIKKIPKIHCPVLVMHSKIDETIPFWHGQKIFNNANEPKRCLWVDQANHNNMPSVIPELYAKTLREFSDLVSKTQ